MNDQASPIQENSIEKHEVTLEDTNHLLSQSLNSYEKFQHSDLNCLKFFQSNELRDVQQDITEETLSPKAPLIEDQSEHYQTNATSQYRPDSKFLFVCGLIRDVDKIQSSKILESENFESSQNSNRRHSRSNSQTFSSQSPHALMSNKKEKQRVSKEFLSFFTTKVPSCYIFQSKEPISVSMINAVLKDKEDVNGFIQTFNTSFSDQNKKKSNLKAFQFDLCVNENQGQSLSQNEEFINFLCDNDNKEKHQFSYSNLDSVPNNLIFIFGQEGVKKRDLLNINEKDSLLNLLINNINEPLRFLNVRLFYQDREYIMTQKTFTDNGQGKREMGMEIRQALRNRDNLIKKLAQGQAKANQFKAQTELKNATHLAVQINHQIFIDLSGIEGLNQNDNPALITSLTNNFSSMTNEILKLSPFYQNHNFKVTKEQENSMFHMFLKSNLVQGSKVLLMCCISPSKDFATQSLIALDYCQKIKCYYNGTTDEEILQQSFSVSEANQSTFIQEKVSELTSYFGQVSKINKLVDRAYKQITNGQDPKLKTKELFNQVERIKSQLLQEPKDQETWGNEQRTHIAKIQQQLVEDIENIQSKIQTLQEMIETHENSHSKTPLFKKKQQETKKNRTRSQSSTRAQLTSFDNGKNCRDKLAPPKSKLSSTRNKNATPRVDSQSNLARKKGENRTSKTSLISQNKGKNVLQSPILTTQHKQTPQFQLDTAVQSSIYAKTTQRNENTEQKECTQFGTINQNSIYLNSEPSLMEERMLKGDDCGPFPIDFGNQTFNSMQGKFDEAMKEIDQLKSEKKVQQKTLDNLKDHVKKIEQQSCVLNHQKVDKRVEELQQMVKDQAKMIESLEVQKQQLMRRRDRSDSKEKKSTDNYKKLKKIVTDLEEQVEQKNKTIEKLKRDKSEQEELNQNIIGQIKAMKAMVEEFKESENQNKVLIGRIERREIKIKTLKQEVKELKRLQDTNQKIEVVVNSDKTSSQIDYETIIKKLRQELIDQQSQFDQREKQMKQQLEESVCELKVSRVENERQQEEIEKQNMTIKQLEKAKTNFKDQTIDLKVEIKHLKQKMAQYDENISQMKHEVSVKNKSLVLSDIKNLIKDYKNEKKMNQTQHSNQ